MLLFYIQGYKDWLSIRLVVIMSRVVNMMALRGLLVGTLSMVFVMHFCFHIDSG